MRRQPSVRTRRKGRALGVTQPAHLRADGPCAARRTTCPDRAIACHGVLTRVESALPGWVPGSGSLGPSLTLSFHLSSELVPAFFPLLFSGGISRSQKGFGRSG